MRCHPHGSAKSRVSYIRFIGGVNAISGMSEANRARSQRFGNSLTGLQLVRDFGRASTLPPLQEIEIGGGRENLDENLTTVIWPKPLRPYQTLNRILRTSPSKTTYSFP